MVPPVVEREYVSFIDEGPSPSGKTRRWSVRHRKGGGLLGEIAWYGSWRRYCFFPRGDVIFSAGCLEDIAEFIEDRMEERE